jgi:serine/threonine-protein kinase
MFPENTIIDQSIRADTKVPKGTKVSITVSQGKLTEATSVPQLAGKTLSEAEKILAGAGLRLGNVTYQQSFDLLPNTVVDQFPRVGEPIQLGQKVDLFVVQVGKPTEEIQIPQR